MINTSSLKGLVPDGLILLLPDVIRKFEINTPLRLAHFLAQCAHESGNFRVTRENLSYSAEGLVKIFPKYFPSLSYAKPFAKQPEKIANKVYANRMGNGDEISGDGFKFRGRGYLQLTGRQNYALFGQAIDENLIANPDKVATEYPLLSASWFFNKNFIHKIADEGTSDITITKITKRINGGTIGLQDRIKHFKEYYAALSRPNPNLV